MSEVSSRFDSEGAAAEIYLDYHAAAPLAPAVRRAMSDALAADALGAGTCWGNPSSPHAAGRRARRVIEEARRAVARSLGATPADLVFTAGGTEACNLMVDGLSPRGPEGRVVVGALAHPAIARSVARRPGPTIQVLTEGAALAPAEAWPIAAGDLVVAQWVDSEVGLIAPVRALAARCAAVGAQLALDATQAYGRLPIDIDSMPDSLVALAVASHKVGGPPGAGALWVRRGVELEPQLVGGAQERGRRAGTPDPLALLGFGEAASALDARIAATAALQPVRDAIEARLLARPGVVRNGEGARVASCTSLSVRAWRGIELVAALDLEGLHVSSGPACSSGVAERSAVIAALYPDEPWRAGSSLRLSYGPERGLSLAHVDTIVARIERVLDRGAL